MKKAFFILTAISSISFSSCTNNNNAHSGHDINDSSSVQKDSTSETTVAKEGDVKIITVTYTNLDAKSAVSIKTIVDQYLLVKNALAADHGVDAANSAKALATAIGKLDKSLLTADQKTAYDKIEKALKENTDQIAKSGGKIETQRAHFSPLSEAMYALVKDFGAGRQVYHDFCPMAKDNQGAMWVSELKEVKNPYFGAEMPDCGSVEEVIQ